MPRRLSTSRMPVAREGLMPALPEWPAQSRMPAKRLATSLRSEIFPEPDRGFAAPQKCIGASNPRLFY
jgi:hypothetical protein